MTIPKILHYCWFGGNPLPTLAKKCIDSWTTHCPDYEIKEWNEDNFNISRNKYAKQAYDAGKYAFVSDYVRLYVLFNYGGIYMDTDVEVIKKPDKFLRNEAFSGFENEKDVAAGIMACKKNHPVFKELLELYDTREFIKDDGSYDLTTNVKIITKYFMDDGLKLNNKIQDINGCKIYPKDYFYPKDYKSGKINVTENTHTIHYFSGSWKSNKDILKKKIISILGPKITRIIVKYKKCLKSYLKK